MDKEKRESNRNVERITELLFLNYLDVRVTKLRRTKFDRWQTQDRRTKFDDVNTI